MKVVISQPMFFPWIGLFEQIKLADTYIHLDDVQMPGGSSLINRVQLKGPSGAFWWTVPLKNRELSDTIKEVKVSIDQRWIKKSLQTLDQILSGLPFKNQSIELFMDVMGMEFKSLSEMNIYSIQTISSFLGIDVNFKYVFRNEYPKNKTEKLIKILNKENAQIYISGLGGKKYIDAEIFHKNNIKLKFMEYRNLEYKQNYGPFCPYGSILLPIAALGRETKSLLVSGAV